MTAIEALLDGFIDYAGVYPPASLDFETAAQNFLRYSGGPHARFLGRFVIDGDRLVDRQRAAATDLLQVPLTICITPATDLNSLSLHSGLHADSFEIKNAIPAEIEPLARRLPLHSTAYIEVPVESHSSAVLDAASLAGARIKLRMGGLVAEAFPSTSHIVAMLRALAERQLAFKATAGLHHPLRSRHAFTYAADSPVGTMHGFLNLFCAAAVMYFGGDEQDALAVLNESDRTAWHIAPDSIAWRSFRLTTRQIQEVRQEFFTSFGSCSFQEPIADLEALGWL